MAALSPAALLALWERAAPLHPIDRTAALCKAARTQIEPAQLPDLPLGKVNVTLLELRRECFGPAVAARVDCERCGTRLEMALDLDAILSGLQADAAPAPAIRSEPSLRAPTLRDLASIATAADVDSAAQRLLDRCAGGALSAGRLSAAEAERCLEALDPAADIALALTCEACAHQWHASLDVAALVWDEISANALKLFDEVHRLATAYGWTEPEILALSAQRRAAYLELCAS